MKKIKNYLSLILIAALMLSLVACTQDVENEKTAITDIEETEKKTVENVIYVEEQFNGNSVDENISSKIQVRQAGRKTFSAISTRKAIDRDATAKDSYAFEINGKRIDFDYKNTVQQDNRILNIYCKDKLLLDIRADTNEVAFFSDASEVNNIEGDVDESQARVIAEEVISKLYGADILKEYQGEYLLLTGTFGLVTHSFRYSRHAYGLRIQDTIEIDVNLQGNIKRIHAYNKDRCANIEKDITQQDVDNALAVINEKLSDGWEAFDEKSIVRDSEGIYYIRTYIRRPIENGFKTQLIYVNIN